MLRQKIADVRGFTLTELMLTVAVAATLMAMAVPALNAVNNATKLSNAAQAVEREMQTARMRAVSNNTTLRFRTNCPAAGYYRIVEKIGLSADTSTSRCNITTYPWPAPDTDLATTPNLDGALRQMLNDATVSDGWFEFRPDGTAYVVSSSGTGCATLDASGCASAIATTATITITRSGQTKTVSVNALGKVLLQ